MNISGRAARALVACALLFSPGVAWAQASLTIAGPPALMDVLVPAALEGFARDRGLGLRREIKPDGAFAMIVGNSDGQDVARFDLRHMGSQLAREQLAAGGADIAISIDGQEIPAIAEGTSVLALASDALVVVVAPDSPIRSISPERLADILGGRLTDWSALGGPAGPINLHLLQPGSDQSILASELLNDLKPIAIPATRHDTSTDLVDAVWGDVLSIGLTTFSETGNTRALALGGECGIEVHPNRRTIKNEDYPLTVRVSMHVRDGDLPEILRDWLAYLGSAGAQGPIRQAGYVDQAPEVVALDLQGHRLIGAIRLAGIDVPVAELRRLAETLADQSRLSISFRFLAGATELDARSKANATRLAQTVASGDFDGRTLTFVGFSDGVGAADQNLRVGRARAEAVEVALQRALGGRDVDVTFQSDAFGEAMPLACDDTDWGRHANRRVEVWVD